jgi:secreted PhoX family phosphatase
MQREREAADRVKIDSGEDIGVNPSAEPSIGEIIQARLSRRDALRGLAATAAVAAFGPTLLDSTALAQSYGPSSFTFKEVAKTLDATHHVAGGYDADVLIRWGDKLIGEAPEFNANILSAAAQERQFGYNCDFIAYFPLPQGSQSSENGLLFVNHEYTNSNLMFAGLGAGRDANQKVSKAQAEAELAAHGASVVEVRKTNGQWRIVEGSRSNRRITAMTPISISGPAAGHDKLKTAADPTGRRVLGMLNNCGGGWTPWGTVLTCEENFNGYFGGDADKMPDAAMYKRYGITKDSWYGWVKHIERFDVEKEPNEPNRFGWVVEIDPYDPNAVPVKRTALGRVKHEAATTVVNADGRVVVYSGDDERFEYVYKFVSNGRYNPSDRVANRNLLDDGTLYVAQFADDGNVKWLPLVQGEGPLTAANGFASQAEVLIYTRKAADLLGATKMDRPEDVETSPVSGRTYVILTNNDRRTAETVNKANPRPANRHGHIIEIVPPGGRGARADHAAVEATWNVFLMAGKPGIDSGAMYHRATTENGWISCPDNCMFDSKGRIWVLTDGANSAASIADAIYAIDTEGPGRGLPKQFFTGPIGAEICASILTPDEQTMFVTVQHPGETSGSTFENPSTRWPDFKEGVPPRPAVVVVTKKGGGPIGA